MVAASVELAPFTSAAAELLLPFFLFLFAAATNNKKYIPIYSVL